MTSTSFNVGLGDGSRVSSRVLRPPGGGHTDIFSSEPEPQQINRRGAPPSSGIGALVGQDNPKPAISPATNQNGQSSPQEPTSAPLPGPEPKENRAKPEPAAVQPAKVDTPKRVRVPPGGFSSGLW